MPETKNKTTALIIGRGLLTAEAIASELRARLTRQIGNHWRYLSQQELLARARTILAEFEPILAENFAATDFAAFLAGFDEVAKKLPDFAIDAFGSRMGGPPRPPGGLILPSWYGDDDEPIVEFPLIQKAAERLAKKNILSRFEFDRASDEAKARAFTVAGDLSRDTLETIRDVLSETVDEGASLEGFRRNLGERIERSFIGPGHLETVYRTQVQSAFHDGHDALADNPIVSELFPYQAYLAIHDARARPDHVALEKLGIESTNIYRKSDPFWNLFTPAWDYNSVATGELITTHRGDIAIESVEIGDVVLTHLGRWRPVLGTHRAKGPSELVLIQTDEGRSVRLTAEHRVFTQNGWIEASRLNVGDELYQVADPSAVDLIRLEINQRSQTKCLPDVTIPIPVWPHLGALKFDSYADLWKKEVEPERRCGMVETKVDICLRKIFRNQPLAMRWGDDSVDVGTGVDEMRSLAGRDHLGSNFRPLRSCVDSVFGTNGRLSFGMPLVVQNIGITNSPDLNSHRNENSLNGPELQSGRAGNVGDARLATDVVCDSNFRAAREQLKSAHCLLTVSGESIGLLSHRPLLLKGAKIISVQRQLYGGMVHDISVAEDESFIAGGLAVSNCRCGINLMTIEAAARAGLREASEWLRTGIMPPVVSRLPFIPFRPPAGFGARRVAA